MDFNSKHPALRDVVLFSEHGQALQLDQACTAFEKLYPEYRYHLQMWWCQKSVGVWDVVDESVIHNSIIYMFRVIGAVYRHSWITSMMDMLKRYHAIPKAVRENKIILADYAKAFNFTAGNLLEGVPFQNGKIHIVDDEITCSLHSEGDWHPSPRPWDIAIFEWSEDDIDYKSLIIPKNIDEMTPLWDAWIESIFPEEELQTLFKEMVGATIIGHLNYDQVMPVLIGEGGSGKGTILRFLGEIMGESNTKTAQSISVMGGRFFMADMVNKSLMVLADMGHGDTRNNDYMQGLELLKQITGGDLSRIERKHRDEFSVRLNVQVWGASNFIPQFAYGEEDSGAWGRRVKPIPVMKPYDGDGDPHFLDNMKHEYTDVIIRCLMAHIERMNRGHFTQSTMSQMLHQELIGSSSETVQVNDWIETCILSDDAIQTGLLPTDSVYELVRDLQESLSEHIGRPVTDQSPVWKTAKDELLNIAGIKKDIRKRVILPDGSKKMLKAIPNIKINREKA